MIDAKIEMDLNTIKQIIVYGLSMIIIFGLLDVTINTIFPQYGNVQSYAFWFFALLFKTILFAIMSVILLKGTMMLFKIAK